jgi:VWFA-related protein
LVAVAFMAWGAVSAAAGEPPKSSGLSEKVEKRLVQLDVAVEGDPDAIRGLTAKDFALFIDDEHEIHGLIVDPFCGDAPTPAGSPAQELASLPQVARPRATFTFFFDQPHLTTQGRERSLELSRELINKLIVDGARASIVSNAKRVETVVPLTVDRERLLAGLERLRQDARTWDRYSDTEEAREQEIRDVYAFTYRPRCPPVIAKAYASEELQIARRSTERLAFAVAALAEAPAPKALVYFGDSLRQYAGQHYLHVIDCGESDTPMRKDAFRETKLARLTPSAAAGFDALINEALARGVHLFTIQAEGLIVYRPSFDQEHHPGAQFSSDTERHQHAQDALVGLAAETGGDAFLGGASNEYIGQRIEARTSCRLLLSFPPGDLPRDKAMNVKLVLTVPKVKIQTQGLIIVPSPGSIEKARLLGAFIDPASSDDGSLRVLIIPRGSNGKTWNASLQLRLQPTGLPDSSAELGASIVRRDKVTDQFASSIATKSGTREMVLEKSLDVAPGEFSVVAVARDTKRGDIGSSRLEGSWPNPAKRGAVIAPIAALQSGSAAMSKDGVVSASGSLARDVDELLDPSMSITLASVVCRGPGTQAPVIVERWIEGSDPNEFSPTTIGETSEGCVQIVDVVHAGRLRSGVADYRIVARVGDEIVAQERRTLRVGTTP